MTHGAFANNVTANLDGGASSVGRPAENYFEDIPKYAHKRDRPKPINATKKTKEEEAELGENPTTADGERGNKDLPSVLSQVGGGAAFLPNMYSMMGLINTLVNSKSETSRNQTLEECLIGALAILSSKYGYDRVIDVFDTALEGENVTQIDVMFLEILKNALANLYMMAEKYGEDDIPITSFPIVSLIGPPPGPLVTTVPDLYIQQYYTLEDDPYPGYIRWNSSDGTDFVFTVRTIGDPFFDSAHQEIYYISEQELAEKLDPYVRDQNLTAAILNQILREQSEKLQADTNEKTLGSGTGSSGENALMLIMSLISVLSASTNIVRSVHLPFSVLNQGSITTSLQRFERAQAEAARLKDQLRQAATPIQSYQQVSSLIGGITTGTGISGTGISVTISSTGIRIPNILF